MAETKTILTVSGVEKIFQIDNEFIQALDGINLEVAQGEFISIVGHSGCGKSTLIRMIAGLDTPSNGKICLEGNEIKAPSLDIGMVFQESRLFPWLSVQKNISFGITDKEVSKKEKKRRVSEMIKLVGLTGFERALPKQLSGGMQQRANIARSLINTPKILLLDEPFGALDAFTRMNMQKQLLKIWKEEGNTMMLVTHDIDEAIFLSTRIIIMSERPGTIKDVINVELEGSRDRSSEAFLKIRKRILKSLFGDNEAQAEYII